MGMSPVRRAFVMLLVAAAAVALLLMFAQDQETLKVRSAVSADDRRHPAYVSALVGAALSRGNRYDVLTNGDQIFPAMLSAINGAKRRISFETYIYDKGFLEAKYGYASALSVALALIALTISATFIWLRERGE